MNKWLMITLLGGGLAIFGYMVYTGQQAKKLQLSQAPIAVAAVRGADGIDAPNATTAGNAVADYSSALQDDVALAQKRADQYNAATKARAEAVRHSAGADAEGAQ